jgi:hypothetical protein
MNEITNAIERSTVEAVGSSVWFGVVPSPAMCAWQLVAALCVLPLLYIFLCYSELAVRIGKLLLDCIVLGFRDATLKLCTRILKLRLKRSQARLHRAYLILEREKARAKARWRLTPTNRVYNVVDSFNHILLVTPNEGC